MTCLVGMLDKELTLNGVDQWMEFGNHQDGCFGNVSYCHHGLSLALWVKFLSEPADTSKCRYVIVIW